MMDIPLIIVPSFNTSYDSTIKLVQSLRAQYNQNFRVLFAVDSCRKSYENIVNAIKYCNVRENYAIHLTQSRKYALGNIVSSIYLSKYYETSWIGILDGDDHLLSRDVIDKINLQYSIGSKVVWTDFLWDGRLSGVSNVLPREVNPYEYQWVSSHFKTFDYKLFLEVPIKNFLDSNHQFFRRCYDHAASIAVAMQKVFL